MSHAYISDKKGKGLFRGALLSLLFTLAFSLFALTLSSLLLLRAESPSTWISLIGVLLPALSALFGGAVSSKAGGGGALSGGAFMNYLCYVGVAVVTSVVAKHTQGGKRRRKR